MERLVETHFKEVLSELGKDLPIHQQELIKAYLNQTYVYLSFILDEALPVIKPTELDTIASSIDVLEYLLDRLDALDNARIRKWVEVNSAVTRESIEDSKETLKELFLIRDEYFKLLDKTRETPFNRGPDDEREFIEFVTHMRAQGLDGQA